jgi:putative aminopeptidase FrvX
MSGPAPQDGPDPLGIARRLLAVPTAPFHEGGVTACLKALLDDAGVPFRADRHGNLIARHRKGRGPRWALVAHTDHPGLEVTAVRGREVRATFLGGVLPKALPGVPVRLHGADGVRGRGTISGVRTVRGEKRVALVLDGPAPGLGPGAFGVFDLPAPTVNRHRIAATAVDDLIGCATVVAVLAHFARHGLPGRIDGVFTRAEEIGFGGAQLLAESERLPKDALVVSLEASMELPGARPGQGPVLRVGDRTCVFDAGLEHHLHAAAKALAEREPPFAFQRQLMSGGTCEATVFTALGYRAVGLAYPLLNYHNVTPAEGIDREEVATSDYLGGVRLLVEAVRRGAKGGGPGAGLVRYRKTLARQTARYRRRLA